MENECTLLLDRWNRYQETGEGVPHDTVVKWLETWGTDKEFLRINGPAFFEK